MYAKIFSVAAVKVQASKANPKLGSETHVRINLGEKINLISRIYLTHI